MYHSIRSIWKRIDLTANPSFRVYLAKYKYRTSVLTHKTSTILANLIFFSRQCYSPCNSLTQGLQMLDECSQWETWVCFPILIVGPHWLEWIWRRWIVIHVAYQPIYKITWPKKQHVKLQQVPHYITFMLVRAQVFYPIHEGLKENQANSQGISQCIKLLNLRFQYIL